MACLVDDQEPSDETALLVEARPDQPCNNVGCDGPHIWEDCPYELRCSGCTAWGHVSSECPHTCARCGIRGHHLSRCRGRIRGTGRQSDRQHPVENIRRLHWAPRVVPRLAVRLRHKANVIREGRGKPPLAGSEADGHQMVAPQTAARGERRKRRRRF